MLASLFDRLTSIVSKHFALSAFVPVLVFTFLNGTVLYVQFEWFRRWAEPQISVAARAFDVAVVGVALAVIAYVVWGLNAAARLALEGRLLSLDYWPGRSMRARELQRLQRYRSDWYEARDAARTIARQREMWSDQLGDAAAEGAKQKPGTNTYDIEHDATAAVMRQLRAARAEARAPALKDLETAFAGLCTLLKSNDIHAADPSGVPTLNIERDDFNRLAEYASDEWAARDVRIANLLQLRFGIGAVAPTAFGNVADSLESYALGRYHFNLPTFWSRLQPLLQKRAEFFALLQDAKAQLDFLVTSTWLCAASTLAWLILLPVYSRSALLFAVIGLVGGLVSRLLYLAAVESYAAFSEAVRTSVDLYRLDLLEALGLQRPRSLHEERAVWDALQSAFVFGQESVNFSYRDPERAP
jgi:hypothetical protein